MDESVVKHLEQPAKVLKLSEAIMRGLALQREQKMSWCGCAIALAYRGLTGKDFNDVAITPAYPAGYVVERFARNFGYSVRICEKAEAMHNRGKSARQVVDWLEAQGL